MSHMETGAKMWQYLVVQFAASKVTVEVVAGVTVLFGGGRFGDVASWDNGELGSLLGQRWLDGKKVRCLGRHATAAARDGFRGGCAACCSEVLAGREWLRVLDRCGWIARCDRKPEVV